MKTADDLRWRKALRCAPDPPNYQPPPSKVTRPLGLYAFAVGPQDDQATSDAKP